MVPVNELEIAQAVVAFASSDSVSRETILDSIPFVTDKNAELNRLKAERKEKDKRTQKLFGTGGNVDDMRL